MAEQFKLPTLGENLEEGEVISVLVAEGDSVRADQPVIEIETEKTTLEVPCSLEGKVTRVHVSEGDTIRVGEPILSVEVSGNGKPARSERKAKQRDEEEEAQARPARSEKKAAPQEKRGQDEEEAPRQDEEEESEEADESPQHRKRQQREEESRAKQQTEDEQDEEEKEDKQRRPSREADAARAAVDEDDQEEAEAEPSRPSGGEQVPAAPVTRRLARELGVDLRAVERRFVDRRVTREQVTAFVREKLARHSDDGDQRARVRIPPLPDFEQWGPVDREALSSLQRRSAGHLTAAWTAPHVTHCDAADIAAFEALRHRFAGRAGKDEPKLTVTALAIKASVRALMQFPRFNSSLDAEANELILKRYYHIGVAVDTEEGLIVPVLRDCDKKSVLQLAAELEELAERTRRRRARLEELRGSTFTITNLGSIGGVWFSPIVNYPEVAILGLARAQPTPASAERPDGGLRLMLCLSYDHRVINGADAARFTRHLAELLEDPELLLLRG